MHIKFFVKLIFCIVLLFVSNTSFGDDTTAPEFGTFAPKNEILLPKVNIDVQITYSDEIGGTGIDKSATFFGLYRLNNGTFSSNLLSSYLSSSNITNTGATYSLNPLPYGKYLYLMVIFDNAGNENINFAYIYVDEPKITINKTSFNSTIGANDSNYDKLICNVQTLGAPYKLEIFKETELINTYGDIIQDWDGTIGVGYILNQKNDGLVHNIPGSKKFAENFPNFIADGNPETYTHELSIATIVDDIQTAGEYTMNFGITGIFDYTDNMGSNPINGKCGNAVNSSTLQMANLCSSGFSTSPITLNDGRFAWICSGKSGGWNSICISDAGIPKPQINFADNYDYFEVFKGQGFDLNSRVTATDEIDGDITQSITKTCTYTYKDIDHQTITCPTDFLNLEHGLYEINYSVTNSFGNTDTKTAEVLVWDFIKIDSGRYHSVALTSHGKFYTWGYNEGYRQGLGDNDRRISPVLHPLSNGVYVVDVAACDDSGHAIDNKGNLFSWGSNTYYSLGNGNDTSQRTPIMITPPIGKKYIKVSCYYNTSVALTEDGEVYTWGWSAYGATGDGTSTDLKVPTKLANLANIVYVNMGHYNGGAIDSSGNLYTWGTNGQGQLGVGDTGSNSTYGTSLYYNTPKNRNSITDAKEICFGQYHAILIKNDGTAYSWGSNSLGRLGNGSSSTNSYSPYKLPISNAIGCSADDYGSSVITSLGKVYYFGSNNFGEMGTGNTNDVHTPTATSLNNVIDTALQFDSSHALVNGMIVYGFGYNGNGELGIGVTGSTTTITSWNFTIPPIVMEVK